MTVHDIMGQLPEGMKHLLDAAAAAIVGANRFHRAVH